MKFFIDNNLSPELAAAMASLSRFEDCDAAHLIDRFGVENRSIADEIWLPELAKDKDVEWIVVSGDYNIYKNPQRREIWRSCNLTTFFLMKNWINQRFWTQAYWLVRWWPEFIEVARRVDRGAGYGVPAQQTGRLKPLR